MILHDKKLINYRYNFYSQRMAVFIDFRCYQSVIYG